VEIVLSSPKACNTFVTTKMSVCHATFPSEGGKRREKREEGNEDGQRKKCV